MKPMKYPWLALLTRGLLGAGILAAAIGIYVVLYLARPEAKLSEDASARPRVRVMAAQRVAVQRQWRGYGTIDAYKSADVPARVAATVTHVPDNIDPGQPVTKGQLLAKLDDSDFARQVEIAERTVAALQADLARLDVEEKALRDRVTLETEDVKLADDDLKRLSALRERNAATQQGVDNARRALIVAKRVAIQTLQALDGLPTRRAALEAQIAAQQASLTLARQNLERATITSPIAGYVAAVDVEVGENLQPGQRVARVVALDRVEAPVRIEAAARPLIQLGDTVRIQTTGKGKPIEAAITRIAPADDPATRTLTVYALVKQDNVADRLSGKAQPPLLIPGAFISATVIHRQPEHRWVVPRRALRSGRIAIVDKTGRVHLRPAEKDYVLETDLAAFDLPDRQWVVLDEASSPLAEGDQVVVNLTALLREGMDVEPMSPGSEGVARRDAGGGATP